MPNFWILGLGLLLTSWVLAPAFPGYRWPRRVAPWLRLLALGVVGWAYGQLAGVAAMLLCWLLLPWLELGTRVRQLRLPQRVELRRRPLPSPELFPALREQSREIEEHGFARVADLGWDGAGQKQFLRLFRHEDGQRITALHCLEQGSFAFSFASISQVDESGKLWRSSTSPLPAGLRQLPDQRLQRLPDCRDFAELLDAQENLVSAAPHAWRNLDAEDLPQLFENETCRQLDHNRDRGLLRATAAEELRYTWRGLWYLYGQVLRQLLGLV